MGEEQEDIELESACAACRTLAHLADGYLAHLESPSFNAAVLAPLFNALRATLEDLANHTNAAVLAIGRDEGKDDDTQLH